MAQDRMNPDVEIVIIAAVAQNGTIGKDNKLPWHYPEDLKKFKEITSGPGKALLMGSKTWESLPTSKSTGVKLPGRKLMVLSRQPHENQEGTVFVKEWTNQILSDLKSLGISQLVVIGGSNVFSSMIHQADKAYITHIQKDYEGDVKFPMDTLHYWMEPKKAEELSPELVFTEYVRKSEDKLFGTVKF